MRRYHSCLILVFALLLSYVVYAPGISGAFVFDDTVNITKNDNIRVKNLDFASLKGATLSGAAGIFGRPISMATFAVDYWHSGMDPAGFKRTNVLIHLAAGVALFLFVSQLLQTHARHVVQESPWSLASGRIVSIAVTAAWLVHPLNLTSVLYVVQRMTSLSALFMFVGLAAYLYGRGQTIARHSWKGWTAVASSFLVFTPLAALSKENGALLPMFLLLTEVFFFSFRTASRAQTRTLYLTYALVVVLPLLAVLIFTLMHPTWITTPYVLRTFSLGERLLTEARVIWLYIRLALAPDMLTMGLYHDDIAVSRNLLHPATTLVSIAGLAALLSTGWFLRRRMPLLSYGIFFFLLGHSMESSVLALELVHEHRNYFPLVGVLLPLFYYLLTATKYVDHPVGLPVMATLLILALAAVTFQRSTQWGDEIEMLTKEVEHHPHSARANLALGNVYSSMKTSSKEEGLSNYSVAYDHYVRVSELAPTDPAGLFSLIILNERTNLPFEPAWLKTAADRIRTHPMASTTINTLLSFERCFSAQLCRHSTETVETLLTAALGHPNLLPSQRTSLLFAWSNFLIHGKNDETGAVKAAYDAAAASPNDLDAQETLAVLLVNMNRNEQARPIVEALRRADRLQLKTRVIGELDAELAKRK